MIIPRRARDTLTAVELQHGDTLEFTRLDGAVVPITIEDTGANIVSTTLAEPGVEVQNSADTTVYAFWCDVRVGETALRLEREVGTQRSFYEPWELEGVRIWLDAVDAIFEFIHETHGPCRPTANCSHHLPPRRHARLAVQDAELRICPETMHPWCPLPEGGLKIEQCYRGEDCWLGAYDGASAHGGLDINHPKGTPHFAPIDIDDQFLWRSVERGWGNNNWRGIRRWPDGSTWVLGTAHTTDLLVPEHTQLKRGTHYAVGAGVWVGVHEHSHFTFAVFNDGDFIRLDPWILFWQMYRDR